MSLFKKVVASIGIGAAKVDTKLKSSVFMQGDFLEGVVEIKGGDMEQNIDSINLRLMTLYGHEDNDRLTHVPIYQHKLNDPLTIGKREVKEIHFRFKLPLHTPMTMQDSRTGKNVPPVWIETGLDIKNAVDPKDLDHISVEPSEVYKNILDAIKIVGFRFYQMENQATPRGIKNHLPYVQQFEFKPSYGKYQHKLDELEVYVIQGEQETDIYFEIDKKSKGAFGSILEKLDLDEHRGHMTLLNTDIITNRSLVSDRFEEIIDSVLN
ncbi:sporulation protein [Metabacillus arenae]|uniref:Sporulation protein n=1 Tax=Metabacillus arenae TaxID=2771434 RepID=A0A926RXJ6_9BACI|nr:sporulation protein [Metabacillus arenae]MBD1381061.1 sporulation protein [Metabacillus arenae]